MQELNLKKAKAYTVYSCNYERETTSEGLYKDADVAYEKAKQCTWYRSNAQVIELYNIYEDAKGDLYEVKHIGKYTDVEEQRKNELISAIKSKLSKEELELLKLI